jgi:uncharacterized coiled-coil protein SlyX
MKGTFEDCSRDQLVAMVEEALEQIQDMQEFLRSLERQIKQFRHRPYPDRRSEEPPPGRW